MHAHTRPLSAAWNGKGIESSPLGQSRSVSGIGNQGPLHELLSRDLTDMLNKGGGGEREGRGGKWEGRGRGKGGEGEGEGRGALNLQYHTQTQLCTHSWKMSHTSSDTCQLGQFTQNMLQRYKMVCGVHLCQLNQVHWSSVSADLGPMQNLLDLQTSNLSHESSQKLPFVSFHSMYMKRMISEPLYHNIHPPPHMYAHMNTHSQSP